MNPFTTSTQGHNDIFETGSLCKNTNFSKNATNLKKYWWLKSNKIKTERTEILYVYAYKSNALKGKQLAIKRYARMQVVLGGRGWMQGPNKSSLLQQVKKTFQLCFFKNCKLNCKNYLITLVCLQMVKRRRFFVFFPNSWTFQSKDFCLLKLIWCNLIFLRLFMEK